MIEPTAPGPANPGSVSIPRRQTRSAASAHPDESTASTAQMSTARDIANPPLRLCFHLSTPCDMGNVCFKPRLGKNPNESAWSASVSSADRPSAYEVGSSEPEEVVPCLLDDLVGQRYKVHGQFDARGLRDLEIDDKLVACRLLKWQERRRGSTKDARGQISGALKAFLQIRPIRHQATVVHPWDVIFVK